MATEHSEHFLRDGGWRTSAQLDLTPILSAALDAFNEQGYHGTSVRDIARRVGVTVPALYYHHENKESILFTLQDASLDRLTQLCEAALADAGDDVAKRFLNLVEAIVLYMANSTKLAALDAEIRSLNPENRRIYSRKRRYIEQILLATIVHGKEDGILEPTSPKDTARALLGMFQAIATWYRPGGSTSPRALAAKYADIAAHTVGARSEVIERLRAGSAAEVQGQTAMNDRAKVRPRGKGTSA